MASDDAPRAHSSATAKAAHVRPTPFDWMELLKTVALPLVTLVLGYMFNQSISERQRASSQATLLTDMTTRREQADSDLRKDMFQSILSTFMDKDPKLAP